MGEGPFVIGLNRTTFNTSLLAMGNPSQPCVIEFYASWCGHCVHFAPEWKKIVTAWHGFKLPYKLPYKLPAKLPLPSHPGQSEELYVARVDCAVELDGLCKEFNVPSFPHLTIGSAATFLSRNLSQIKVCNSTGAINAKNIISWIVGELNGGWGTALDSNATDVLIKRSNGNENLSIASRPPQPVVSLPRPPPLLSNGTLWTLTDVESATTALYLSIAHSSPLQFKGREKRQGLKSLLRLWSLAHPSIGCKEGSLRLISKLDQAWPDEEGSPIGSSLQDHAICGSKALEWYLMTPPVERYMACRGDKEGNLRGFTCGLWLLFHKLAAGLPEWKTGDPGLIFLDGMRAFAAHFFLCEDCARHFNQLLASPSARDVNTRRDAILWVWRVHNQVNERLMKQELEAPSHSSGPMVPKIIFPSAANCPKCRLAIAAKPRSETEFRYEDWDLVQVLHFLEMAYGSKHQKGDGATKARENSAVVNDIDMLRDGDHWVKEEDSSSSEILEEQLSSSWAFLEIDLFLTILGLCLVGSFIASSVCIRRGSRARDRLKPFHYTANSDAV